jgi:hypothetical protein
MIDLSKLTGHAKAELLRELISESGIIDQLIEMRESEDGCEQSEKTMEILEWGIENLRMSE